jgi:hypothetical protein
VVLVVLVVPLFTLAVVLVVLVMPLFTLAVVLVVLVVPLFTLAVVLVVLVMSLFTLAVVLALVATTGVVNNPMMFVAPVAVTVAVILRGCCRYRGSETGGCRGRGRGQGPLSRPQHERAEKGRT